jgi:hypothetical protein
MPPLLAALLMIEMGCSLAIIEAIDLNMEWNPWRADAVYRPWCREFSESWYDGRLAKIMTNGKCLLPSIYMIAPFDYK